MKKELTEYTIQELEGLNKQILKAGKIVGHTACGVVACLEHVFILEGSNKKDWYIEEDGKIYRVDKEEYISTMNK